MAIQKAFRDYAENDLILTHGADGNHEIFYMKRETAAVEVDGRQMSEIGPGEWFGELSAILGSMRTADVRAKTPCSVLIFKGIDDLNLYKVISKDDTMMRKLVDQICLRLIETTQKNTAAAEELEQYRGAISGTLFALEKLSRKHQSKPMDEIRNHLSDRSGIPAGKVEDTDADNWPTCGDDIFKS